MSAVARMFCRETADHLPTTIEAMAWPYFSDPPIPSRSGHVSATMSSYHRALPAVSTIWTAGAVTQGLNRRVLRATAATLLLAAGD
ncbi:hypothetical protein IW256_003743 [Actinomadura viridis]|uniref:Uncharacterized protein n=1 Tax=Actinomadura viridis TaxID=58110 RepID=A0A931GJX3_9ACTN|nr:hypothetical protein [Actinomadura viridis]MBG6089630.1 hypothetical protein [Actinomadura viridis]